MLTVLFRIIKYGLQNFARNSLLSIATIAVMVIALMVFLSLVLFGHITDSALVAIKDKIDISVYFRTNVPEDDILQVKRSLETVSEVKSVEYISRDMALTSFKQRHEKDNTISQAVEQLGENPLSASLNVKAYDPNQYANISSYLNSQSLSQIVEKVSFAQNQTII